MNNQKHKLSLLTLLSSVILVMLACSYTPKSWSSDNELERTREARETQAAQTKLSPMVYPLRFKGIGAHTRDCRQDAEIIFNAYGDMSCNVQVSWPAACEGPLADLPGGLSISFDGTITERDKEPSFCELTTCNTGEASGTVYFTRDDIIGESILRCPGNNSVVDFNPLDKVNLEPVP